VEKEMLGIKRSTEWLVLLLFYAVAHTNDYILWSVYHVRYEEPIYRWITICVATIFWLAYMLYLWRGDLAGFLKRIFIAIPFALMFAIFMMLTTGSLIYAVFGLSIYLFLLFKTSNWKQHFYVTLLLASILVIALKLSTVIGPYIPQKLSIYRSFLPAISIVFCGFFYGAYIQKVKNSEIVVLYAILIRILKSVIVFSLYIVAWFTLENFRRRHLMSLSISFAVLSILSIVFLWVLCVFNLLPVEQKKKNSKLSKLQSELNEFYLKECEKLKAMNNRTDH
jgi:hypothetical protein